MKKGTILKTAFNKYTIIRFIGEGGNSRVFEVSDGKDNYAIKILKENINKTHNQRFKNELYFGLINQHENIIQVIDHGLHNEDGHELSFYVMPLYKSNLREEMKKGILHERIIPIFLGILRGLKFAHEKGITHRDIKPENILYDTGNERVIIADFGIAQFTVEELWTIVETKKADRLANYQYSAPEQRIKGGETSQATDIYAAGLILNEMFTGSIPQGEDYKKIRDVNPDYDFLDGLVSLLIKHHKEARLQPIEKVILDIGARIKNKNIEDKLKKEIERKIDESELKDPLIIDPIRIINAEVRGNKLFFKLNQSTNGLWIQCFQSFVANGNISNYPKEAYHIDDNNISVILRNDYNERLLTELGRFLKGWISIANQRYKIRAEQIHRDYIEKEKMKQAEEIKSLERQKEINKTLAGYDWS